MSTETSHVDVQASVREATRSGHELRAKVRHLVTDALIRRKADPKAINSVMQAAVEGVGEGLGERADLAGSALGEAMTGIDEAVSKSVFAMQMAVEEAWSHGRRFADEDLREALDAVTGLEDDMMATLKRTGERAQGGVKAEFERLREHLAHTGTDTGGQVKTVVQALNARLGAAASGAAGDARQAAELAGERLTAVASGLLRGLADRLDHKPH